MRSLGINSYVFGWKYNDFFPEISIGDESALVRTNIFHTISLITSTSGIKQISLFKILAGRLFRAKPFSGLALAYGQKNQDTTVFIHEIHLKIAFAK